MITSPAGERVGSSLMSAHIRWRRRPSSLSLQGGAIRRHTQTRTGLHSPLIMLPANKRIQCVSVSGHILSIKKSNVHLPHEKSNNCLLGNCYFLGVPLLLADVRTHGARYTSGKDSMPHTWHLLLTAEERQTHTHLNAWE